MPKSMQGTGLAYSRDKERAGGKLRHSERERGSRKTRNGGEKETRMCRVFIGQSKGVCSKYTRKPLAA